MIQIQLYSKILTSILLTLFIISCENLNSQDNIYGNWVGIHNGYETSFVFETDSTCTFNYYDKYSGGFKSINGKYKLDFSKNPIPLSIRNIAQLNNGLYTILEFINKDLIRIVEFSPKWRLRPISFDNSKTLFFKRT